MALVGLAAGFGQFGAVATLGDVARSFGRLTHGATLVDRAGLSGTQLGLGLAALRLASLAGLPLAGLADRYGRRFVMLASCGAGLALTAVAGASPGYWWFVAVFALGRPLLSAAAALAQVSVAEQTGAADRSAGVALVAAGYAVGSGFTAILSGLAGRALGFRGVIGLAAVPLVVLPWIGRHVKESDRFTFALRADSPRLPVWGAVAPPFRRRLLTVAVLAFAVAAVSGPATSFFFLYVQNVRRISGPATAGLVAVAGVTGFAGLLAGRWLADRLGRRPTAAAGLGALVLFGVLTYSGSAVRAALGYVLAVLAGAVFAPAAGALVNELFPTSVRASVAGWQLAASVLGAVTGLVAFGAIADVGDRFAIAALITFLPVLPVAGLFWLLPETRGREPEDLWPPTR
ncbi:MAG: MFS transporter [Mycobacteriales bacterium]